jgi:hypothetical protein
MQDIKFANPRKWIEKFAGLKGDPTDDFTVLAWVFSHPSTNPWYDPTVIFLNPDAWICIDEDKEEYVQTVISHESIHLAMDKIGEENAASDFDVFDPTESGKDGIPTSLLGGE